MKLSFENYLRRKTGTVRSLKFDKTKMNPTTKLAMEFFEKIIKPETPSEAVKNALELWEEGKKK